MSQSARCKAVENKKKLRAAGGFQAYSHEFHNVIILISGVRINYRIKWTQNRKKSEKKSEKL